MTGQDPFITDSNSTSIDCENVTDEYCETDGFKQNAQDPENSFEQDNVVITDDALRKPMQDDEACIEEAPSDVQVEAAPVNESGDNQEKDKVFKQVLETLTRLEDMFTAKIDRSEYELETLKRQSEEIQEYKLDLYASISCW